MRDNHIIRTKLPKNHIIIDNNIILYTDYIYLWDSTCVQGNSINETKSISTELNILQIQHDI